jgi:hypothetical protein
MNSEPKPSFDDGLEWLREIRRQIDERCGHDLKKLGEYYRKFDSKYPIHEATPALMLREAKHEK